MPLLVLPVLLFVSIVIIIVITLVLGLLSLLFYCTPNPEKGMGNEATEVVLNGKLYKILVLCNEMNLWLTEKTSASCNKNIF